MSFSANVKEELSKINIFSNLNAVKAEVYGYLLTIDQHGETIKFQTENEYNINRLNKLLNRLKIDYKIKIQGKNYLITFEKSKLELQDINLNQGEDILKAVVRGAFLGAGSVTEPNSRYHLEIRIKEKSGRDELIQIINKFGTHVKELDRKYSYSIYIKDRRRDFKVFSINSVQMHQF